MCDLDRSIDDDSIEWRRMSTFDHGVKRPEPVEVTEFDRERALALMLMNEVVFLNNNWWKKEWPEEAQKAISINVNCNDVFAWASADAEGLPYSEVETIYKMWRKDPDWGPAVWCIIRRKEMPQRPVEDSIRKAGVWDLDRLGLRENTTDAEVQAYLRAVVASGALNKNQTGATENVN